MLKEVLASNAAKLVAACVCPVVGAGVVTMKVPQVREAVHKATSPKPKVKREARAKPRVRTPKKEGAQHKPVETAQMCADPELLKEGALQPTSSALMSMPAPRLDVRPPEQVFVTNHCPGVQFVGMSAMRIAGVPEPATWAQMIAGFALMGGTLRAGRRRARHMPVTRGA